jgi:hypothetical protein
MKTMRIVLLNMAIGLALASGFSGTADARQQDSEARQRQAQRDHARKPVKAKATPAARAQPAAKAMPAVAVPRGEDRRAHASEYRSGSGRQDAAFAASRPDPHARDARDRAARQAAAGQAAQHQAAARKAAARESAARQAAIRQASARQAAATDAARQTAARQAAERQAASQALARKAAARDLAARQAARRQAVLRDQAERHWQNQASRVDRPGVRSTAERQRLIALQRQRAAEYQRYVAERQRAERQRIAALQEQRRLQQYRYQQWYWQQQRILQDRWNARRYDYANDPYYYTPASYRYVRAGRAYEVNRYAADLLQQAVRYGYEMGVRAGNADRMDGWRSDWRNNPAYLDASYGYNGYYVDQDEYNYYFRQGFQRGYRDAYGNDYRYGTYYGDRDDGSIAVILASVLQAILGLQAY